MDKYISAISTTPKKTGLTPSPRNIVENLPAQESEVNKDVEPWPNLNEFFTTKPNPNKEGQAFTATCQKCFPKKKLQVYRSSLSNMRRHYEKAHLHLLSNFNEAAR